MVANVLYTWCTGRQAVGVHLYSVHTWPNYGLLPGVTDLGTAQSGSGTRQGNISHQESCHLYEVKLNQIPDGLMQKAGYETGLLTLK